MNRQADPATDAVEPQGTAVLSYLRARKTGRGRERKGKRKAASDWNGLNCLAASTMPPKSGSHYRPSAEFLPLMISHSNKPWKAPTLRACGSTAVFS